MQVSTTCSTSGEDMKWVSELRRRRSREISTRRQSKMKRAAPERMRPSCDNPNDQTASDSEVKLKSFTLIGGTTTAPPASVPARRTAGPIASRLFSMKRGESLKRKFLMAFEIFPFSVSYTHL